MSTNKKGNDVIRHKDAFDICQELRTYIFALQSEWNLYETNWQNDDIPNIQIPQTKLNDISHYEIYNKCMNQVQFPNVSSVLSAMIEQVASENAPNQEYDDDANECEEESG